QGDRSVQPGGGGERADRRRPGERAEVADGRDRGDRDGGRGAVAGSGRGAEHGRGDRREADAEERPADQRGRDARNGDRHGDARGGRERGAADDREPAEAGDEAVAGQPRDGQGQREEHERGGGETGRGAAL